MHDSSQELTLNHDTPPLSYNTITPSWLFIGDKTTLIQHTIQLLQTHICAHNACTTCNTCLAIRDKQHHSILWISPEKTYTRENLAPIFYTLGFILDPTERFFIIIEKADQLTASCANSLLKSLEEPPHGYIFILLTDRIDQVLPTVRSRCISRTVYSPDILPYHDPLFTLFTNNTLSDTSYFIKTLDKEKLSESETRTLIDRLLAHWTTIYQKAIIARDSTAAREAQRVIHILTTALRYPPMPGSSKLALKNLYLQIKVH